MYDHILESVGEKLGESFYILPSSVHECIIVPDTIPFTREMLRNMVRKSMIPRCFRRRFFPGRFTTMTGSCTVFPLKLKKRNSLAQVCAHAAQTVTTGILQLRFRKAEL